MSRHEIPYTRNDLLLALDGQGGRMLPLFVDAANGQKETFLHAKGWDYEGQDDFFVYRKMQDCPEAYFLVPQYLWEALRLSQSTQPGDSPTFHGIKLIPWDREFIVAKCDGLEVKSA